jgi:hypothetical protein
VQEIKRNFIEGYNFNMAIPWIAAERGFIDAVIQPHQTRLLLRKSLRLLRDKQISRHGDLVGYYVSSAGVVGVLALTMLEYEYFWIASALYLVRGGDAGRSWSDRLLPQGFCDGQMTEVTTSARFVSPRRERRPIADRVGVTRQTVIAISRAASRRRSRWLRSPRTTFRSRRVPVSGKVERVDPGRHRRTGGASAAAPGPRRRARIGPVGGAARRASPTTRG